MVSKGVPVSCIAKKKDPGLLGENNFGWESRYEKRILFSTYVKIVPKSANKFYLDFAHRFHHDQLHVMINMADVMHLLMLWCGA